MSRLSSFYSGLALRFLLCIIVTALAGLPIFAQDASFFPELSIGETYNSNLLSEPGGQETSDLITRAELVFPYRSEWRTGSLSLSYAPSFEWYQDNDRLNHDEHQLRFGVDTQPGRRSSLTCDLQISRTQDQGSFRGDPAEDSILVPRSERDYFRTELGFEQEFSRKLAWYGTLDGGRAEYSPLEAAPGDPPSFTPENRSEYGGRFGLRRTVSERARIGGAASYQLFDLETSGEEEIVQLLLTWNHSLENRYETNLEIGGLRREITPAGVIPLAEITSDTDFSFDFSFSRILRRSRITLFAGYLPSAGGSLEGTSTDTTAGIRLSGTPDTRWSWTISSYYALRDPTDATLPEFETLGGSGRLQWQINRLLGLRFEAQYADRTSDTPGLDAAVTLGQIMLSWYPAGTPGREG